jgi:mono/diheme cytochrome c family protein
MKPRIALFLLAPALACATEEVLQPPDPSLNRMIQQPKYVPYGESQFFADGRAMREPPPGTVPRAEAVGRPVRTRRFDPQPGGGLEAVDRAMLEEGRRRFEIFCAPCHGVAGDGVAMPATAMELVPPPSLHREDILAISPEGLYEIIAGGYGLMPSYDAKLDVPQIWAVVAYVRALQASRRVPVDVLPETDRRRLEEAAP